MRRENLKEMHAPVAKPHVQQNNRLLKAKQIVSILNIDIRLTHSVLFGAVGRRIV